MTLPGVLDTCPTGGPRHMSHRGFSCPTGGPRHSPTGGPRHMSYRGS